MLGISRLWRIKHDRAHFEREAERCVPHLSPEDQEKWIKQCLRQHPGYTRWGLTGEHGKAKRRASLLLSVLFILLVIFILMWAERKLHAQADDAPVPPPPPADLPLPVEPSDREKIKDLWVEGFLAFARVEDANLAAERYARQAADAKVDGAKRQKELDEVNNRIATTIGGFREKYKAHVDRWCLTRQLAWTPKVGDKPCPAIFADDTPQPQR